MPRENSFSDSEGRSLTPDLDEEMGREAVSEPLFQMKSRPSNSVREPRTHQGSSFPTSATPKDRFRSLVRKIIIMNRGTSFFSSGPHAGAEPGINPRRASAEILYGHIHEKCIIEITDYSSLRSSYGRMSNDDFIRLIQNSHSGAPEPWVKVRWINIGGISWDVIKAVSIKYHLHPLAIEDIFHVRKQTRSKADYYARHLFLRILCHELDQEQQIEITSRHLFPPVLPEVPRSTSPEPLSLRKSSEQDDKSSETDGKYLSISRKRMRFLPLRRMFLPRPHPRDDVEAKVEDGDSAPSSLSGTVKKRRTLMQEREFLGKAEQAFLDVLKEGERVLVKVSPMFVFLLRGGIVISIHQSPDLNFTSPISKRLLQRDTGLRTSADSSLLVHALLDLVVDKALEVADAYHSTINKFERDILLKPSVNTVRYIHILSGDLILHKRTLEPIKALVYALRRYDVDRCTALIDTSDPANANMKVVGFMSHKAKIYLADVNDHMDYILNSLDMFSAIAENLISYTFNLTSYEMNDVMRRLTLATIICLPLTLLTGYFGMNFATMWSVQKNSDLFFWELAIPIMFVIITTFMIGDIKKIVRYLSQKMSTKRALEKLKME